MTTFTFNAPTLFDPEATATQELKDILHDAPAAADMLATRERFVLWLQAEMGRHGFPDASRPFPAEDGWSLEYPSKDGATICTISHSDDEFILFHMSAWEFRDTTRDACDVLERILSQSPEITDLVVSDRSWPAMA